MDEKLARSILKASFWVEDLPKKCDICTKPELCRLFVGRARECDATAGCQVKLFLTQALLCW